MNELIRAAARPSTVVTIVSCEASKYEGLCRARLGNAFFTFFALATKCCDVLKSCTRFEVDKEPSTNVSKRNLRTQDADCAWLCHFPKRKLSRSYLSPSCTTSSESEEQYRSSMRYTCAPGTQCCGTGVCAGTPTSVCALVSTWVDVHLSAALKCDALAVRKGCTNKVTAASCVVLDVMRFPQESRPSTRSHIVTALHKQLD